MTFYNDENDKAIRDDTTLSLKDFIPCIREVTGNHTTGDSPVKQCKCMAVCETMPLVFPQWGTQAPNPMLLHSA